MRGILDVLGGLLLLALLVGIPLFFALAPSQHVPETSGMAQKPTLGRIVLYAFLDKKGMMIVERPAEIVAVWPENTHGVNLHVKLDGTNDLFLEGVTTDDCKRLAFWATSIAPADDQGTPQAGRWRWPPRE